MKKLLVSFVLGALEARLNLWSAGTPWDYVQSQTNLNAHEWLGKDDDDIKLWVLVGGHYGDEIDKILGRYRNCVVEVYEPSARYYAGLAKKFSKNKRVQIRRQAISSERGTARFYETSLEGSGSLLPLGKHKLLFGSEQAETFDVETSTLDFLYKNQTIDILQIDVQGAEHLVLLGAGEVLARTGAVLIEVAMEEGLYEGSSSWVDLSSTLQKLRFVPVLVGVDTNLTGNALFLRLKD